MTIFGKAVRAAAIVLALAAGSMHTKPAKADGGAVVAGIAGGLILGTIIGSTANAYPNYNRGYYAPAPTYYAPRVRTYYAPAPVYYPRSCYGSGINIGIGFSSGRKYYGGKRYHRGGYGYRGHKRRHHHRRHH